ncbi:unnamed protein product, partial [Nesidiocoris tenuis]
MSHHLYNFIVVAFAKEKFGTFVQTEQSGTRSERRNDVHQHNKTPRVESDDAPQIQTECHR